MAGVTRWKSGQEEIFNKFTKELQQWCETSKEPASGSREMRYFLDLQRQRLRDRHLTFDVKLDPEGDVISASKVMADVGHLPVYRRLSPYEQSMHFQHMRKRVSYSRDGKKIYDTSQNTVAYQTIIEPSESEKDIGLTYYNCPNCGAVTQVYILEQSGCPYCNTRFQMKELFPKVTNLYFQETIGLSGDQSAKRTKKAAVLGAVLLTVFSIAINLVRGTLNFSGLVSLLIFGNLVGALFGVLADNIILFARGTKIAVSNTPLLKTVSTKSKITKKMRKYDPAFSYEYFEGKAISLARVAAFASGGQRCPQYRPSERNRDAERAAFKDILDIQYRGGFLLRGIQKDNDLLRLELELMMTDTVDSGKKIRDQKETWTIRMHHKKDFPVDPSFSIHTVQCKGCGGSFDAMRTLNCPYCGREYEADVDDWIVDSIRIN